MSSATTPLGLAAAWDLRRVERDLLLACLGCVALGFVLVLGSSAAAGRVLAATDLLPLLVYGSSLALVHLALVLLRFRGDQSLVVAVAFLSGFGLLAQSRMGAFAGDPVDVPTALAPALVLYPAGFLAMLVTALILGNGRYRVLARGLWFWLALSLAVVAVLLVTGQRFRGAVYALGFTTPTEVLKITVVLGLAAYLVRFGPALARWHPHWPLPPWRPLWPLLAFATMLIGLLALQRDLGMILILSLTLITLLVSGTGRGGYLAYALVAATALGAAFLYVFAHGQRRIDAWLDPFQDPTGDGWQILQGLSGMYAGGLWGEGFGEGAPQYTPIAASDFIYSVIGEELGFLGCVLVVLFFLILFQRGFEVAGRARDPFGRLLALGLTTVLATQTLLNIGGVTKSIPLTGMTLPFISHGGASLLTGFTAIGLLLAISDGAPGRSDKAPRAARPTRPPRPPGPSKPGGFKPPTNLKPRKAQRRAVPRPLDGTSSTSPDEREDVSK